MNAQDAACFKDFMKKIYKDNEQGPSPYTLKVPLKGSASHYIWRNHATSPSH
jgi:hypothetical protein